MKVGKDIEIEKIKKNFDAVYIAIGTQRPIQLWIKGEDTKGVLTALDFLRQINEGKMPEVGERVIVVGGGSTAFDSARSAVRLGAKDVSILYRRSRWDMPALPEEKAHAIEEGIKIFDYVAPVEVVSGEEGFMEGVRCIRMAPGEFDSTARRKPVPIKGSEFIMDGDTLIIAIGSQGEVYGFDEIKTSKNSIIEADSETMETSVKGIFAGGDCIHGPDTVIKAIADGRKAALSIDKYLGGNQLDVEKEQKMRTRQPYSPLIEEERKRLIIPVLDPEQRVKGFNEIELPFDEESCKQESFRCLRCDIK